MHRHLALPSLMLLVGQIACQQQSTEVDVHAINAVSSLFGEAAEAGDLAGMVAAYAPDVVLMPPNQEPVTGSEGVRAWFQSLLEQFKLVEFNLSPAEVVVTGDWAYRRATFSMTLAPLAGGEVVTSEAKLLQIWQRLVDDQGSSTPGHAPSASKHSYFSPLVPTTDEDQKPILGNESDSPRSVSRIRS